MSDLESAVSFAAKMVREGQYAGKAVGIAAGYYKVGIKEVRSGLSARSGRSQAGKKKPVKPVIACENCGEHDAVHHGVIYWGFNQQHVYMCAECGPRFPAWWEQRSGPEAPSSVKWTKYTPSKVKVAVEESK